MQYGIVVDSSSDLRTMDFVSDKFDFTVVPLTINVGEHSFLDDDNLDAGVLLQTMKETTAASMTACPSPGDFQKAFEKSDYVFCFTMTSVLSGTYNSARLAKEMVEMEDDNKRICIIDTGATAGSIALLAYEAQRLIEEGHSYKEICQKLNDYNDHTNFMFTLSIYDNLVKSGRMSNLKGMIATKLHINLICEAIDGEIAIAGKVRGTKKCQKKMVEMMFDKGLHHNKVMIHHVRNLQEAIVFKELILSYNPNLEVILKECKGITTFYANDGGILISY